MFIRMAVLLVIAVVVVATTTTASTSIAGAHRCFLDPVWEPEELYHDFNHPYGSAWNAETNQTQELLMDFYAPPPQQDHRAKRPTVLLIHGGSFVGGDKSSFKPLATVLAQRGFIVGSINYRLTGRHWGVEQYCCPGNLSDQYAVDAVHDMRAAVRYLRKMAPGALWRLDTARIGIAGGSAGAVSVAFYGYAKSAAGEGSSGNPGFSSDVSFVMPISGELRYDAFCEGGLDPVSGEPLGCHFGSWDYIDQIGELMPGRSKQPPLLAVHGTSDTTVPIREAKAMVERANATGTMNVVIHHYAVNLYDRV